MEIIKVHCVNEQSFCFSTKWHTIGDLIEIVLDLQVALLHSVIFSSMNMGVFTFICDVFNAFKQRLSLQLIPKYFILSNTTAIKFSLGDSHCEPQHAANSSMLIL